MNKKLIVPMLICFSAPAICHAQIPDKVPASMCVYPKTINGTGHAKKDANSFGKQLFLPITAPCDKGSGVMIHLKKRKGSGKYRRAFDKMITRITGTPWNIAITTI